MHQHSPSIRRRSDEDSPLALGTRPCTSSPAKPKVPPTIGGNRQTRKSADYDVGIVGAGPYGLSAAAHLKTSGTDVRVFGKPMAFWSDRMPEGMLLRSPRVASNLSDPQGRLTLGEYETVAGTRPCAPVLLETFVAYGRWFQQQLSVDLDQRDIFSIRRDATGFVASLDGGQLMRFRRIVVAAGIGSFVRRPTVFERLDHTLVSHCYEGRPVHQFAGKRVIVIGAGQSSLESAALLHEAGADVELIARNSALRWIGGHPWLHRLGPISDLLYSKHDVGPAGISRLVAFPRVVHRIPLSLRDRIRTRAVRPAGARWLPDRLAHVKITTGRTVLQADSIGQEARLKLDDGSERAADHVLLGTGYSVDIGKYQFLSPDLVSAVRTQGGYPVLASGFRCSVPGLYFIGATAARSFGPLLYFVAGTEFASRVLTSHVTHASRASARSLA
jgi:thioredoxin reductase